MSRVAAFAFQERTPPDEMQLWNVGENPTDYGVHVWSERSAEVVFGRYEARGNPLVIDVEHNVGKALEAGEVPIDGPLGGYARLEIRSGAPWLTFDWSKYAVDQIAAGERRFLSPEYDVDPKTGEILALYRVSLVADPGTHRARMLASATERQPMDLAVILAALRAALAAEDPAVAKESITNLLAELEKKQGDGATDPPAPSDADGVSAATGDDGANADNGKTPVAASAPATLARQAAPAAAASAPTAADPTIAITAASAVAVRQVEDATRDHLLATQGDRLEPSIRRWASAQPLAIVKGLLGALPAGATVGQRTAATRGQGQGEGNTQGRGLQGRELEELQRGMGTFKASTDDGPREENDGRKLVLPSTPPSIVRAKLAGAASAKGGK